jgi:demethylmenaquinone methyltransferase/2-methoxy-6-polyprenyl-1,4-benzoquinol methylase
MQNHRDYFNAMAEKWDDVCHHDPVKISRMLAMLDIQKGSSCLDVGTGTGIMIPYLMQRAGENGKITAIDMADQMLNVAQSKYASSNVEFICGDVLEGNLPSGSFDAVVCYSVFPHFSDKQAAINILSGYLKKGGRLLIGHTQSRDMINHMHQNAAGPVNGDTLPDMASIRSNMDAVGLIVVNWADDGDLFAVVGKKRLF